MVPKQPIRYEQQRRYPLSVAEAWRLLADTDHLNRAIGLPAVEFSPLAGAADPLVRHARAKAYGVVPVSWREFPFDWVRERRYTVRREFESGPLDWLEGGIELLPADDGVTVRSFALFAPKNVAGKLLWRLGRAPVAALLEFCDVYLTRKAAGKADPVPVPKAPPRVDRARLDALLEAVAAAPVSPGLVPLLRERVVEGSDDQVTSLRAFALADRWGADRLDVLRLLLHSTRAGLFELRWELMCPNCRIPKAEVSTLASLPPQFHCDTCGISYAADVEERVELRFSVNPAVRDASDEIYCIGGPLRMPHVAAQQLLPAHEERRLELPLSEPLLLRTIGGTQTLGLIGAPADPRVAEVKVTYAGGRWSGPHSLLQEDGCLAVPAGAALTLRNQTDGRVLALVENLEWTRDATTLAQAGTLQEFRDLFGSEVLRAGQQVTVRHAALLSSAVVDSTGLYEQLGDAAAHGRISRHFELIAAVAAGASGAVVKTVGDRTVCAFTRLDDAFAAGVALQRQLAGWCRAEGIDPPLELRLGLHAGSLLATTANDRLDYLGRTANIADWLADEAGPGELVLLPELLAQLSPELLEGLAVERFDAARGHESGRALVRVTPQATAEGRAA